jgi:phenylalanyl-tRNA synthetase beta chain
VLESAGGKLEGGEIDVIARPMEPPVVHLRQSEVTRILGKDIAADEIARILRRLGFRVTGVRAGNTPTLRSAQDGAPAVAVAQAPQEPGAAFEVQVPTWRLDVSREIDAIEEIARIYGYDNFENTLPEASGAVIELPDEHKDAQMRDTLLAEGYHQAMSWTFIGGEEAQKFTAGEVVNLENPISDEAAVMRTSLLPGMLQMLAWNLNRGNNDVRLFEEGHVFERVGDKVDERKRISLGATGNSDAGTWDRKPRAYSFFDMKGDIESLLSAFEHRSLYFDEHTQEYFHPGRSARAVMDGETVARFGQLHPDLAAARKIKQDVYIGEISLDRLYQHPLREPHYTPIPRYPAVDRDFSFVFDNAVTFERIRNAVKSLHIAELKSFSPAEVFRGGAIPEGKYSVLLRAEFQSAERTLRDEDVAQWAQGIVKKLEGLGGTMRA